MTKFFGNPTACLIVGWLTPVTKSSLNSEEQASKAIDKKETLILDRESKSGLKFKTFARFDKDLNTFVTIPYDTKVEKRILASQKMKENLAKKPTTKIEKPVVKTAKKVGRKM